MSCCIQEEIAPNAVFIIGAGHFGNRAARLLSRESDVPVFVVDLDPKRLSELDCLQVKVIKCDGIDFLVRNLDLMDPMNTIVPAVPLHLAFEWLKACLDGEGDVKQLLVPEEIKVTLPHTWPGSEGSLLVSYADFVCPDDCSEPEYCSVTGERRDTPLYDLLERLDVSGFQTHVIRSYQLAPGLGGYKAADLAKAAQNLRRHEKVRWLLGTACKCHGILTAFEF